MNALSLSNRTPSVNGRLPEMDHLLDRVFDGFGFTSGFGSDLAERPSLSRWPALDVREAEKEFTVSVDLPGVEQKDIELGFHDGTLSLKAHREGSARDARYRTRWSGSIERSIRIDPDVDVDQISASLKHGVLTVTLPKKPERQPRRIQIE